MSVAVVMFGLVGTRGVVVGWAGLEPENGMEENKGGGEWEDEPSNPARHYSRPRPDSRGEGASRAPHRSSTTLSPPLSTSQEEEGKS